MYSEKIKIEDVIAHLNSLVGDLAGRRIGKDESVHRIIGERCEAYLNSLGLRMSTWGADLIWDKESDIHLWFAVFRYETSGLVKDKRFRYGLTGTFKTPPTWRAEYENGVRDHNNPVTVTPDPGMTVRQYILKIERAEREASVKASHEWFRKCQAEVDKALENVMASQNKLTEIDQVIAKESGNEGQD